MRKEMILKKEKGLEISFMLHQFTNSIGQIANGFYDFSHFYVSIFRILIDFTLLL